MSSTYEKFKGAVILNAHLTAKAGQGDIIAKILVAIKENANSDKEPGCSTYRIARDGDEFAVWERYEDHEAIQTHFKSDAFKELASTTELKEPPTIKFYEEF